MGSFGKHFVKKLFLGTYNESVEGSYS